MTASVTESPEEIVNRSGSNLAFALRLLPVEKRRDMGVFYAFCRVIDDIADNGQVELERRREELDWWRDLIYSRRCPAAGLEDEFCRVKAAYGLSPALLDEVVSGVEMDLEPGRRFATVEELKDYCHKVASAVGLISIEIFGYTHPSTRVYAEQLGYALQWTNILRDVGEDAAQSRLYLPLEEIAAAGLSAGDILSGQARDTPFRELMKREAARAWGFYREAVRHLSPEDRASMKSPELMRRIYSAILRKMERDSFRVFEKRYRLSKFRMAAEYLRAAWAR